MPTAPRIHVDLATERLWRDGVLVPVTPKVFRLLRTFVTRPARLLTNEALLAEVWPGTNVAEGSVKDCVKQLRALLHDDVGNPRFIETIRGRGYVYRGGILLLSEGEAPPLGDRTPLDGPATERPGRGKGRRAAAGPVLAGVLVLAVVAVAGVGLGALRSGTNGIGQNPAIETERLGQPVVAISPFAPLSEGEQARLLAGAFTAGVAAAIARAPDLIVVRGSAGPAPSGGTGGSTGAAVTHVLGGSVQVDGEVLRLTATLEDSASGRYLWADRYDLPLAEVLTLQDRVAQRAFSALRVHLVEGERARIGVRDTESLEAWLLSHEAYGEYLKFDRAANRHARDLWTRAAALDPAYATPVAGLALTHWAEAKWGWSNSKADSLLTARDLAERTIAVNPDEPLGHQALGTILFEQGFPDEAIAHRMAAVELAPNDISVVAGLAIRLNEYGRHAEALPLFERSLRLAPLPPWWVHAGYGIALHMDGRPDEALGAYQTALAMDPARPDLHARIAAAHADQGDTTAATAAAVRVLELVPDFSVAAFLTTDGFQIKDLDDWLGGLLLVAGLPD